MNETYFLNRKPYFLIKIIKWQGQSQYLVQIVNCKHRKGDFFHCQISKNQNHQPEVRKKPGTNTISKVLSKIFGTRSISWVVFVYRRSKSCFADFKRVPKWLPLHKVLKRVFKMSETKKMHRPTTEALRWSLAFRIVWGSEKDQMWPCELRFTCTFRMRQRFVHTKVNPKIIPDKENCKRKCIFCAFERRSPVLGAQTH